MKNCECMNIMAAIMNEFRSTKLCAINETGDRIMCYNETGDRCMIKQNNMIHYRSYSTLISAMSEILSVHCRLSHS